MTHGAIFVSVVWIICQIFVQVNLYMFYEFVPRHSCPSLWRAPTVACVDFFGEHHGGFAVLLNHQTQSQFWQLHVSD